jgi:hypothetical protein
MKKQHQNVRSTKQKLILDEPTEDVELTQAITKQNISVKVVNAQETAYSNQTGGLPVQSSQGNTLLMVYFDVDANYIDAEPMQNHKDNQMIQAYQKLWTHTNCDRKTKPIMLILDNEASEAFKTEIKKNCNLQFGTARHSPPKFGRESNSNFQEPFHCNFGQCQLIVSNESLGPSGTAGSYDRKPVAPSKQDAISISV